MSAGPVIVVRKKRRRHDAHHGGAWKVAYADFVTALMAFFLVMWLVGQDAAVRQAVAGYFRDPGLFDFEKSNSLVPGGAGVHTDIVDVRGGAAPDLRELEEAAGRIEQVLNRMPGLEALRDQIEIQVTAEGLRIELVDSTETGFFDTGSTVLSKAGEEILTAVAAELASLSNDILLEGHTDSRPYSSSQGYTNWELSADRANAARRVMERHGLRAGQVKGVRGYADVRPRIPGSPLDDRNRRVSIVVAAHGGGLAR